MYVIKVTTNLVSPQTGTWSPHLLEHQSNTAKKKLPAWNLVKVELIKQKSISLRDKIVI